MFRPRFVVNAIAPPSPAQFFGDIAKVGRGEYTGQVYCPRKTATIAAMKCGQYQVEFGCAAGCPNAASPEEIAALAEERLRAPEAPDKHHPLRHSQKYHRRGNSSGPKPHDYGVCAVCGKQPAIYKASRECARCYRMHKYDSAPRQSCGVCGRRVRTPGARVCQRCNGKRNAREYRMSLR